jgi:carboxyl-terminal processing protease
MIKKFIPIFFLLIFYFCVPFPVVAFDGIEDGSSAVREVMNYIYDYHISEPDTKLLTESAIKGMVDALNDPYTEYLSPEDLKEWNDRLDAKYIGIGIELELGEKYPVVTRVIEDSPADKSGILAKDEIIIINGKDASGWPLPELIKELRGSAYSEVFLSIRRAGNQQLEFKVKRGNVSEPDCFWEILLEKIGYIRIDAFGNDTAEEFKTALKEMEKADVKGLILDLRFNGGGYIQTAEEMASFLLPPGQVIFTTIDRYNIKKVHKTPSKHDYYFFPMVILINNYSASASEVFAAAMADHKIAKLVGTRSFGKGVIQTLIPLETGGALKLTTGSYLTPNGESINNKGLTPDRIVSTPEMQLVVARWLVSGKNPRQVKFAIDGKGIFLDGEKILEKADILKIENDFYIPFRPALEALGYTVEWRAGEGDIFVYGNNQHFLLPVNNNGLITREGLTYAKTDVFNSLNLDEYQEGNFIILENK